MEMPGQGFWFIATVLVPENAGAKAQLSKIEVTRKHWDMLRCSTHHLIIGTKFIELGNQNKYRVFQSHGGTPVVTMGFSTKIV